MQTIVATLTHEQQSLVGAIVLCSMPAPGARLAGVMGIHFHCHTAREQRLVGKVAVQFGKGPLGGVPVRSALLLRDFLAMPAFGAFTDMGQVFQADDAVWVALHNAPTDRVVGRSFQPSLPSTDYSQSPGGGTGAFVLQPLSQSAVMVRFGPALFARIEGGAVIQLCGDRQVAASHIDAHHVLVRFGRGLCHFKFQGHEQVELLPGLVIPQFGNPDVRALLHESDVLAVTRVRDNRAPREGEDAHLLIWFQAVVPVVVVGQRRGDILGWLIESLVAFLGDARLTRGSVLLHLGPERLVGGSHLTGNITGHLCRQVIDGTHVCIRLLLQPFLFALLAMGKCVAAHRVQGVAVGQLGLAQGLELVMARLQFQLDSDHLLHRTSVPYFTEKIKWGICEQFHSPQSQLRKCNFSLGVNAGTPG